jgi:hypothetical protein
MYNTSSGWTDMQSSENTNDLISLIYDASLDSSLWATSLLRISDTIGGSTTGRIWTKAGCSKDCAHFIV